MMPVNVYAKPLCFRLSRATKVKDERNLYSSFVGYTTTPEICVVAYLTEVT